MLKKKKEIPARCDISRAAFIFTDNNLAICLFFVFSFSISPA